MATVTSFEFRCYDDEEKVFVAQHTDQPHEDGCMIHFVLAASDGSTYETDIQAKLVPQEAQDALEAAKSGVDAKVLRDTTPTETHEWLQGL